jgi:5S rRNA maturation endonuclease (ribonuclease M5)
MARYRAKDETDLRWNRIRRRITRELDTELANWREFNLNKMLTAAWDRHVESLESGKVLELESHYESWVGQALDDAIQEAVVVEGESDAPPVA